MKRTLAALAVFSILSLTLAGSASAFRCGTRLISVGDTRSEVLSRCGEPSWVDNWEEDRVERVFGWPYYTGSPYAGTRYPLYIVVRVTVEEWTYNMGPSHFIRILRFENGRIVSIETGDYGY